MEFMIQCNRRKFKNGRANDVYRKRTGGVMKYRIESDSMGKVEIPADRYWGAQTQRALGSFKIGNEMIPMSLIRAHYHKHLLVIRAFFLTR